MHVTIPCDQCFFVTVRAGTAYRKIWRLVNNFFARIIRFTVQKFQLFWVIFCIIIFFIELWHILVLWLAKMPNGGMPVFTLIATGWRYRKIFFYKKSTACDTLNEIYMPGPHWGHDPRLPSQACTSMLTNVSSSISSTLQPLPLTTVSGQVLRTSSYVTCPSGRTRSSSSVHWPSLRVNSWATWLPLQLTNAVFVPSSMPKLRDRLHTHCQLAKPNKQNVWGISSKQQCSFNGLFFSVSWHKKVNHSLNFYTADAQPTASKHWKQVNKVS